MGIQQRKSLIRQTHSYLIGREEAKDDIGLPLTYADETVDKLMWSLYKEYEECLELTRPASAEMDLGTEPRKSLEHRRAIIESLTDDTLYQHVYVSELELIRVKAVAQNLQVPVDQIVQRVIYMGWRAQKDDKVTT